MKKKFSRILGVGLTIALVASLGLVMAAPTAADPGDITSYRARLEDRGGGEVTWDDVTPGAGVYSVKLDVDLVADGASYSFRFLPPDTPRMAPESGNAKPGVPPAAGFPLSELASASDINVLLNLSVDFPTPYVNLFLYVPTADPYPLTKAAGECLMSGISQWDEDLGFPQHGWTLWVMEGTQVSPVDGSLDVDTWELYEPDDAWYNSTGAGAGVYPGKDLAWWQGAFPEGIVLGAMIMNGRFSDAQGPCNVDDFSITHTPAGGSAVTDTYVVEPQIDRLLPSVALDVKGAVQKFNVNSVNPDWVTKWEITPVVNLTASDIVVTGGGMPNWACPPGAATVAGTGTHADWIAIRSLKRGDCHVMAEIQWNGSDDAEDLRNVWGEKKWGEISRSTLDVDPVASDIQHTETVIVELDDGNVTVEQEWIEETVWANFYWGDVDVIEEYTAGHALVHWWLIEDTTDNQDVIHDLMDDLELGNDGWSACGKYDSGSPPFDIIDTLAAAEHLPLAVAYWKDELGASVGAPAWWYTQTETEDDWPGEMRGHTWAELGVLLPEDPENGYLDVDLIIVTLAEYPHDYSGENAVSVQMGKKEFTTVFVPPAEVKTTQVRWAGEKIVLEKDWTGYGGKLVMFALEEGSIGDLIPIGDVNITSTDSRTVFTAVDADGVARVMFKTEQQGQVDVECVLYDANFPPGASFNELNNELSVLTVVENTGFLVYYLFLEEVTPWEPQPEAVDPGDSAAFAVDVKGCFWATSLPGTMREARTITFEVDGGGTVEYELPAGRYVLPDDWPLMAGPNWRLLRPWMDLMADPGNVSSLYELGPYGVVNSPSGVAALPCIGPFSSLQPWSAVDQWITDGLTVPADGATDMDPFSATQGSWSTRNTVIPDDWVSPFDCPMPPAEIHFVVTAYSVPFPLVVPSLSEAFKDTGPTYDWPFYASEIPANRLIPPMLNTVEGYWWDSWEFDDYTPEGAYTTLGVLTREGPYWFHIDLEQTPLDDTVLEAYSDNLGTAAVWIDALGGAGSVTIKAFADYPYLPAKFPPVESGEVTQVWGAIDLNPHFTVDKEEAEVGEVITFDPSTTVGGTPPYVLAEWDMDGDGEFDEVIVELDPVAGTDPMDPVEYAYPTAGSYKPGVRITDSTVPDPLIRSEYMLTFITITGGQDILAYYRALTGDLLVADLADVVAAANDYLGGVIPTGFTAPITLSQLVELANEWLGL